MERQCSERDYVAVRSEDPYLNSSSSKFDREVTNAFLQFHADLMSGFRRFLFFINDVPFFNGTGFLKSKNLEDGSYEFLAKVIESRAFDGFLEQESDPSLYNDFLASGDVRILGNRARFQVHVRVLNRIGFLRQNPRDRRQGDSLSRNGDSEIRLWLVTVEIATSLCQTVEVRADESRCPNAISSSKWAHDGQHEEGAQEKVYEFTPSFPTTLNSWQTATKRPCWPA